MTLLRYELRKLLHLPALWMFFVLCLGLNILLMTSSSYGRPFFNEVSKITNQIGQRYQPNYISILQELPQDENIGALEETLSGYEDPFDDYDTQSLSQYYEEMVKESPATVRWLQNKYEKAAVRVTKLANSDGGLDIYAGPITHDTHQFLFGTLLRAISVESYILAILLTLYLFGVERQYHTELAVYTTRQGRHLLKIKALAGVVAALALFILLAVVSLSVYFTVWDYSGIWGANVSSGFNYVQDILLVKPFITWADFTVAGYLLATLSLIGFITVLSVLFAAAFGTIIRNTYLNALVVLLICSCGLALPMIFSDYKLWIAYEVTNFTPVTLWLTQNVWFTESGISSMIPWQESMTVLIWLVILLCGVKISQKHFDRKDIA